MANPSAGIANKHDNTTAKIFMVSTAYLLEAAQTVGRHGGALQQAVAK
jgi:hypothetical protein